MVLKLNDAQARAAADMYNLVEAALAGDTRAADQTAATMRTPRLTAKLACFWMAEVMQRSGLGPEVIDAARCDAGLGRGT